MLDVVAEVKRAPSFLATEGTGALHFRPLMITRARRVGGALFRWEGASIPVVAMLQHLTGAAPLLVGFGREEDKIHCPNESFGLDQFVRVMTWSTLMLKALE